MIFYECYTELLSKKIIFKSITGPENGSVVETRPKTSCAFGRHHSKPLFRLSLCSEPFVVLVNHGR